MKFRWSVVTSIKGSPSPTAYSTVEELPFLVSEKHVPARRTLLTILSLHVAEHLWHSWSCSGYTAPTCTSFPMLVRRGHSTFRKQNHPWSTGGAGGGERSWSTESRAEGKTVCLQWEGRGLFKRETWEREGEEIYHLERTRGPGLSWERSPARKAVTSTHVLSQDPSGIPWRENRC